MKMSHAAAVVMSGLVAAFAMFGFDKPAAAAASSFSVYAPGCNADVFTQIPDMPDLFIGRQINVTDSQNGCKGKGFSLALLQMDWSTHRFRTVETILQTPAIVDKGAERIDSAIDPYIAKFDGEYWIAFECAGKGIIGGATCIGPFDPQQPGKGVDLGRTYLIVNGRSSVANDKYSYSASDPKLLTFQNHLYLYWTAIKSWHPPGVKGHQWLSIAVRGMELDQQTNGQRLLWGKGLNGVVDSYDPAHNVEVWGPNPSDPLSNQTVDMFSIMSTGNEIYATAGVGGTGSLSAPSLQPNEPYPGCLVPDPAKEGCFRLAVAASATPMGEHIFDGHLAPDNILPSNAQEYARFYRQPDGALFLMGHFLKASSTADAARALPAGVDYIPLPTNSPLGQWMKTP